MPMTDDRTQEPADQVPVEFGDVQGHAYVAAEDAQRILDALKGDAGGRVNLSLRADDSDVEGHSKVRTLVSVIATPSGDDVEGHAISLRFPSATDADLFRRRLLATGAITGALLIGGAGIALHPTIGSPAGVVSQPARAEQMQQAQQYAREQRLMESSAAGTAATSSALGGRSLSLQQQAQQAREQHAARGRSGGRRGHERRSRRPDPVHAAGSPAEP